MAGSALTAGPIYKFLRIAKGLSILAGGSLSFADNSAKLIIPVGTKPATCTVGQLIADSADSNKLYECTTTNTWTKVGTQA